MKSWRRHRWIALIALFGLLFQQAAMAAFVCPLERMSGQGAVADLAPPCHAPGRTDPARCHEHCSPTTSVVSGKSNLDLDAPVLALQAWSWTDDWGHVPNLAPPPPEAPPAGTTAALIVRFCRRLE